MKFPEISIVVTTWNNASSLRQCLDSLKALHAGEILLCDCGSSDRTLEVAQREYAEARILSSARTLNFAQARNFGLKQASNPYVLFSEADWIANESSVAELLSKIQSRDRFCIAVPQLRDSDGGVQIGHNVRRFPTATALCLELLLLHKLLPTSRATQLYRMMDFDHRHDREVEHACGAFVLVKRDRLLEIGGYDERFAPAWIEDVDLSRRLAASNLDTIFCAHASAGHIGKETTRHFIIEHRYDHFYRSVLLYSHQYLGRAWQVVRICMIVGMLERIFFSFLFPRFARTRLLRSYRIYNSDEAIQSYKWMYFRALAAALKGERNVQSGQPIEASPRLPGWPSSAQRQAYSPDDRIHQ